jgi:hypothetical protein
MSRLFADSGVKGRLHPLAADLLVEVFIEGPNAPAPTARVASNSASHHPLISTHGCWDIVRAGDVGCWYAGGAENVGRIGIHNGRDRLAIAGEPHTRLAARSSRTEIAIMLRGGMPPLIWLG